MTVRMFSHSWRGKVLFVLPKDSDEKSLGGATIAALMVEMGSDVENACGRSRNKSCTQVDAAGQTQ